MAVTETFRPLPGETTLGLAPPIALRVESGQALKRARFATGRVLTPQVLLDEQSARSQCCTALQQALASGVVRGFETPYVQGAEGGALIDVAPGLGLAAGEDLVLPAPVRLSAALLPVARESLERSGPVWSPADRLAWPQDGQGSLAGLARQFAGRGLPPVAVLLARPIRLLRNLTPTPAGPCQDDPDPMQERLALEDALRFEWVLWPARDHALPPRSPAWRNRLAWRVFDLEVARQPLPWQALGLPIALAAFDDLEAGRLAFLDRQAVAREGGGLRARTPLLAFGTHAGLGAGLDEPLAQAQVLQLAEHLAELPPEALAAEHLVQHLERLPPAGLLPATVVDFTTARQTVFPASWSVSARPISDDMVEPLLAESAPLAPLSLAQAEQVELLVPVPAAQFEPELLKLAEPVDPLFRITLLGLEDRRARALRERAGWQHRADVLAHAVSGLWPEHPAEDPHGLDDEKSDGLSLNAGRFFPRVHAGGVAQQDRLETHGFDSAQDTLVLAPGDSLFVYVEVDCGDPVRWLMLQPLLRSTLPASNPNAPDSATLQPGPVVWWGRRNEPEPVLPNVASQNLRQGGQVPDAVDPAGQTRWLRLEVAQSTLAPNPLESITLEGLVFGTHCSPTSAGVHWGHAGALRAGRECHWVAETLPQGAHLRPVTVALAAADGNTESAWNWVERRAADEPQPLVEGFSVDPVLHTHELSDVSSLPARAQGNPALQELLQNVITVPPTGRAPNLRALDSGLAALLERLDRKSSISNDLVEFGFLRSRVDLYRLRTRLLGADEADRLLSSPAVADLVKRSESSYATDQQLTAYLAAAAGKAVPPPAPAPAPTPGPTPGPSAGPAARPTASPAAGPSPTTAPGPVPGRSLPSAPLPSPAPAPGPVPSRAPLPGLAAAAAPGVAFTAVGLGRSAALPAVSPPASVSRLSPLAEASTRVSLPLNLAASPAPSRTPLGLTPPAIPLSPPGRVGSTTADSLSTPVGTRLDSATTSATRVGTVFDPELLSARDRLGVNLDLNLGFNPAPTPVAPPPAPTPDAVAAASNFNLSQNSITLAERLKVPVVVDAWSSAAAGKSASVDTTVATLNTLGMPVAALPVFGYQTTVENQPAPVRNVGELLAAGGQLQNMDLLDTDLRFEADYFRKGIDAVDNSIRFLRGVEGMVEYYRRLRALCEAARNQLGGMLQRCNDEVARLNGELAEIRHDLDVARALLAEERTRIAALLARRRSVLAQVPYVMFRRPLLSTVMDDLPVRSVETGLAVSPVPACTGEPHAIPPDLQAMVDALRHLPASHFNRLAELMLAIDNRDELVRMVGSAAASATVRLAGLTQASQQVAAEPVPNSATTQAVQTLRVGVMQLGMQQAAGTLQAAPSAGLLGQMAWSQLSQQALTHVAVGDLLASSRTLGASGELDDIARVAGCLHRALGGVPPAVRLSWALRLSSFDTAPSLRSLTVLPGFGDPALGLDFADWRGMQQMVDWLFSRIDARSSAAERLMNDLVRVTVLLASQAPVRALIPARLLLPVRPSVGVLLELAVDPLSSVRVGMQVSLGQGLASALVQDVAPGRVLARVTQASSSATTLAADSVAYLSQGLSSTTMSMFSAQQAAGR